MRALLTLLVLAAIVIVVLVMTDVINIRQTNDGRMPEIAVDEGEMPEFEVDTADIDVATERRSVEVDVPTVSVRGADEVGEDRTDRPEMAEEEAQ
ncbi:hypothetical protein [Parasphingopyxis marina]|uniref:Uncharacterized protein n=1 Tax=Parasphingopyxis marina TaxID=2761622 RepID=A0A842I3L0_9SPHN|nr:hypothetical protein [Parasphingopyxis marina]MBC2779020.1 hypothetical protein [Parasphingopyxis marina]